MICINVRVQICRIYRFFLLKTADADVMLQNDDIAIRPPTEHRLRTILAHTKQKYKDDHAADYLKETHIRNRTREREESYRKTKANGRQSPTCY